MQVSGYERSSQCVLGEITPGVSRHLLETKEEYTFRVNRLLEILSPLFPHIKKDITKLICKLIAGNNSEYPFQGKY